MKRYIYGIILLFAGALSLSAQDREELSEQRNVDSFDAIDVGKTIKVYLEKGNEAGMRLVIKNGSLSDVETEVSSGKLHISIRNKGDRNIYDNMKVKVYLTYVELKSITVHSVARVSSSSTIVAPSMNIEVSTAASVEVPLKVKELKVYVSSAGKALLTGSAGMLYASASSAGKIEASNLKSTEVTIKASSGANVNAFAKEKLIANASSGAVIHYLGDPAHKEVNSSSGGSISK